MNYQEIIDSITTAILKNIKKAVDSQTQCDHTFKAKVTEIVSEDKIRVLHSGKTYTTATSIKCEIGDMVRVCAPCNNFLDLYVVENKTKGKTLRDLEKKCGELEARINNLQSDLNLEVSRTARDRIKKQNLMKEIQVDGDKNTYYPVAVRMNSTENYMPVQLGLGKHLGSKTNPDYPGNHPGKTSSCSFGWVLSAGGWDGNERFIRTLFGNESYAELLSHVEMNGRSYPGVVLWLRGGGTIYRIFCDDPFTVNIYYNSTNLGSTDYPYNVAPRTDIGNHGKISYGTLEIPGIWSSWTGT